MKHWQPMTQEELKKYVPDPDGEIERLQKQLRIATKALKDMPEMSRAQRALKEMEGVK